MTPAGTQRGSHQDILFPLVFCWPRPESCRHRHNSLPAPIALFSPKAAIARAWGSCLSGVDVWLSWGQRSHLFPAVGTGELASHVPPAPSIPGPAPACGGSGGKRTE